MKCKSSGAKYPELSFYRFPKDEERCAEWVLRCGRKDLQGKPVKYLNTNCRICAKHFEPKQILNTGRLVWNAVPTKFKHQHSKSRKRERERAKQIHARSGPLGQRLKKKLAHLDTVNDDKKEEVISQEPLSKYLKFSEKDLEVRVRDQRQNVCWRNLQSTEKDAERREAHPSQEPASSKLQTSDDDMTVIEMDHSYINADSELSEGHNKSAKGVEQESFEEDQPKAPEKVQSPHQSSSEHSDLQPDCQKTPKIAHVKSLLSATLKPIKGTPNVQFQLVDASKNSQTTCLELVNKDGSYFLVSSEVQQQRVPLRISCPSTSKLIQFPPTNVQNETSHSIQKTASVKKLLQKVTTKPVGFQACSQIISTPNGHHPHVHLQNVHEITKQSGLEEQTKTNIKNVHHEEIVVAAKCTRRSVKKNSSTLRVRLFRAKLKIKKLEAALEKMKKQKSRHKEKKKRALKEVSWASLTLDKRKLHGRRYSERQKRFAIGLYKQSRKAYQFCRKELSLPSVRSLQEWMKKDKSKSKHVLSESLQASVPAGNYTEADGCTAEEEAPRITGLISVQETTEAVSPGQDIEVLIQTSEQGGLF